MKITGDEAREMVYDDHEDFEEVESSIIDTSRWSIIHEGVFKHIPTGKFYQTSWSTGATEMQDESPFEYESEVELEEVEQQEVTVIKWVPKK